MVRESFSVKCLSLISTGETQWTISGQQTGISDIPLTARGERQVKSTGSLFVGPGRLLDPRQVKKVFLSPRRRALRTFELLFGNMAEAEGQEDNLVAGVDEKIFGGGLDSILVTEQIREWDYGEYEGIRPNDVKIMRKQMGLDKDTEWWVWRDGCPGGEYVHNPVISMDQLMRKQIERRY